MKYILSILFIILLTGCQLSTGKTVKKISAGCTSICLQATRICKLSAGRQPIAITGNTPAVASLSERTASILVW